MTQLTLKSLAIAFWYEPDISAESPQAFTHGYHLA
jgi:hypothetical protein